MNRGSIATAALIALLASSGLSFATDDSGTPPTPAPQATTPSETTPLTDEDKRELTPEEKAEKEARKECKMKICDILATRDPNGDDVACDIVKTWREEDITKMLGGKISWPWGKAVCQSKLEIKR
ncbi:MAG: hypothetical protein ACXWI1_10600, partial [Croceibacterium sp.]